MSLEQIPPVDADATGTADEVELAQVLDAYLADLEGGRSVDADRLAEAHPAIAERLRACLAVLQAASRVAGGAGDGPDGAGGDDPGPQLGDFRIVRPIGRGGMGVVYEAVQLSLGRRVALKVLPFTAALDPQQRARFKVEAQAAACLHHTHIVPIYWVGCERGVHYYAMQFIEGRTVAALIDDLKWLRRPGPRDTCGDPGAVPGLAEAMSEGRFAPPERVDVAPRPGAASLSPGGSARGRAFFRTVARLGAQAAEALDHAHRQGVVHRDVKPANLLLDAQGELWVTDFGLARLADQPGLTQTGDVVGTLRYMSPEQALARRVLIDHRSDVYSLGATLYELLTLRPAVEGRDRQELLRRIAQDEPSPLRRHDPAIPRELETVVLKAMPKEPESRYATAQELADDLRRFREVRPIRARRPGLLERATKWARRHRAVTASVLALLVLATIGSLVSAALIARERDRAVRSEKLAGQRLIAEGRAAAEARRALAETKQAQAATERALKESEAAREQAEAVSRFLVDAFRRPDPEQDGRELKVIDL